MKTGCLPSDQHDLDRRLWMANYVDTAAMTPAPPAAIDHSDLPNGWGELGNDQFNDCPVAAAGHAIQLAEWWGQKPSVALDVDHLTKQVEDAYHDMTKNSA